MTMEHLNINLDHMSAADLRAFAVATITLSDYAMTKAFAQEARLKGEIASAMTLESRCDDLYGTLPAWARW
jgi:hypothetical protein